MKTATFKKFVCEKQNVIVAKVEYNNKELTATGVFNALKKEFPEYSKCSYHWKFIKDGLSVCEVYQEEVLTFIESRLNLKRVEE